MASAVMPNRNEPSWPARRGNGGLLRGTFMGKVPHSNPKPKPNMNKRQFNGEINNFLMDDLAVVNQPAFDDASSINHHFGISNYNQYVSFNIASYSKKDLIGLKKQLVGELERVRQVKNRIDSLSLGFDHLNKSSKTKGVKRARSGSLGKDNLQPLKSNLNFGNLLKTCSQILNKLMKQRYGVVFNKPVDVVGLGLHDYFNIIKHPMDLGTVKSKLAKNSYASPLDFAEDVRLTFNNAMKYNPKGDEVHLLAEQWLMKFEKLFRPLNEKLCKMKQPDVYDEQLLQESSWKYVEVENVCSKEHFNSNVKELELEEVRVPTSLSKPPSVQSPVKTPSPVQAPPVKPVKQPKPKAKDLNKREMSLDEKHKLGFGLQSLPDDKMDQVVQIVKKRNGHLRQDGDEIELDIEAIDTETLWELDRLVTNWKKMMGKVKKQAHVPNDDVNAASSKADETLSAYEKNDDRLEANKPKKGDMGEEDVDIGDEMPMSGFPPVEIDRDAGGHDSSSSGSSSSSENDDSSSSSDSDSEGGSSDSDSDDKGQS